MISLQGCKLVNPPDLMLELAMDLKNAYYEAKRKGIQWARGRGHLYYDRVGTLYASAGGLLLLKASNWNYSVARKLLFERPYSYRVAIQDTTGKTHKMSLWSLLNGLENGEGMELDPYPQLILDDYPRQNGASNQLNAKQIANWLLLQYKNAHGRIPVIGRDIADISQVIQSRALN